MLNLDNFFESDWVASAECRYGRMMYLKNDLYIGRSLEVYGEWYEAELKLLRQIISPGDVVLDVGANIGTHTLAFSQMVGESGRVMAFEPQLLLFKLLTKNININRLMQANAFRMAIGKTKGFANIPILNPGIPNNFGGMNIYDFSEGEKIEIFSIDSLGLSACDFIKIDVEGLEADVLMGAENTLRKYRPTLYVESNKAENAPLINEVLLKQNYLCYWHFCHGFNSENFRGVSEDVFNTNYIESNLLCLPREKNITIEGLEPLEGVEDHFQAALTRLRGSMT